jgi:hypothetical protein
MLWQVYNPDLTHQPMNNGDIAMFKGFAELTDAGSGDVVATFHESSHHDWAATVTVRLRTPVTLEGTGFLAIYGTLTSTPVITVEASDPDGTEIREFHGKSAIGRIPEGGDIALVRSPGGPLGTLLIVMGKGTVRRAH